MFEKLNVYVIWYNFETLPVASTFNPEPMNFLSNGNLQEGSKIRTMLSKSETILNFYDHLTSLPKLCFGIFFVSTFRCRSMEVVFYINFCDYFVRKRTFGIRDICEADSNTKLPYTFKTFHWKLALVVAGFLNYCMQRNCLKIIQTTALKWSKSQKFWVFCRSWLLLN